MRNLKVTFFFALLIISAFHCFGQISRLPYGYPQTQRNKWILNTRWKFHLGDPEGNFYEPGFDDSIWEEVSIPHTLKLTSLSLNGCKDDKTQPTFHRNVGWYRKEIRISDHPSKKIFLEFEGAHQVTDLWVNGKHVGQHAVGGYTPFIFDISSFVDYGEDNQLTLLVDNRRKQAIPPDPGPFDYVKFSGLYRDVYLVETASMHITFNIEALNAGVTISTPSVDPVNRNATVNIKTQVENESERARTARVLNRVVDAEGNVVLKMEQTKEISPGGKCMFNQTGGIEENLHLWSLDDPYLYKVNTLVMEAGKPIDCIDNDLGIRKFELDEEDGFRLNGEKVELIGFNRHQNYPYIGDAVPNSLHYKDMLQFKKMGFNVVRTAHYPQDDALLEACDELGILVYEEPPTWIDMPQNSNWFDNLEKAARIMVRNHHNHPSAVIWGAGINHRGYVPRLHYAIKQEDPTRLTASQSSFWTGWQSSGLTDIYANMLYSEPIWKRQEPMLAMEGRYGPEEIARYKRDPLLTGMISWVAYAYYTFHDIGNWENRTRLGIMDAFRYPKDSVLYWYPTEMKDEPSVYVDGQWIPNDKDQITVYSNCQKLELLVNGRFAGRYKPSSDMIYQGLDHPPFIIDTEGLEPGKLTLRGIINGKIMVEKSLYTPGRENAIRLTMDTTGRKFVAGGSDILMGYAEIVDESGTVIQDSEEEVTFTVEGNASVVGDGEGIGSNPVEAEDGMAPLLLRAGENPGTIKITGKANGLQPDSAKVESVAHEKNVIRANAYPIYDFEEIKVDMGADGQLVQFGWEAWNGEDDQPSSIHMDGFDGFTANIRSVSDEGVLRWLGEMNVIGKFGYLYGEGVLGLDDKGIILEFDGLKEGKYTLKTYHHAPRSNTNEMDPNKERLKKEVIHKLPYAKLLKVKVMVADDSVVHRNIKVTEGKELQFDEPGTETITFSSNGESPVRLIFKDQSGNKGVWLNGFELKETK